MELVPSGVPLSFEVTFDDPGLDVGMAVFDTSAGSPVQVGSVLPMTLVYGNTYFAKFNPSEGASYVLIKGVYTDETFVTLSPDYAQGSESIYATLLGGTDGGSACELVGYVIEETVVGTVECA